MRSTNPDDDDLADARALAEHVLSMDFVSAKGQHARDLARRVLGIPSPNSSGADCLAITTNGTTRFVPIDEPVFLIRGQDVVGAAAVRAWADLAEANGAAVQVVEAARGHAAQMELWPHKKVADLPTLGR